jgi:hypothetical protein
MTAMHALLLTALLMPTEAMTLSQPPKQPPVNDPTRNLPRDPARALEEPPNTNTTPNTTTPQAPDQGFGNVNVNVDGTWTVLAYERNGTPVTTAGAATVTIRNNIMTLGTKQFRLRFGPRNMIFVTEITGNVDNGVTQTGGTTPPTQAQRTNPNANTNPNTNQTTPGIVPSSQESGVYVLSMQFFCISVFENNVDTRDMRAPGGTTTQPGGTTTQPQTGNFVPGSPLPGRLNAVLVLKRVGT